MRFRNGKKSFGLIALLSCVFTATVAFAAYTGYNYINGSVTVEGSPFKMVFATDTSDSATVFETTNGVISPFLDLTQGSAEATDMTVKAFDSSTLTSEIESFTVTLKEEGDAAGYRFAVKNTGGAPAYLKSVNIAETTMPTDGSGTTTNGLQYSFGLMDGGTPLFSSLSENGQAVIDIPDGSSYKQFVTVDPGESITVLVGVEALPWQEGSPIFWAYDADADTYGAAITLGQITITWSAVDPSQA